MAQKWSAFTDGSPVVPTDLIVGLRAGANRRFDASGVLIAAQNLADVGDANTAFNNVSPVTTKGDIIYRNATVNARLPIGTDNYVLSVATDVPAWISPAALRADMGIDTTDDVVFNDVDLGAVDALTAFAGGGQGSATLLSKPISRVTTVATGGDSVLLPAATAGKKIVVINAAAANAMDVFPQSGEFVNALAVNVAISVAANKVIVFYCAVDGTWNSNLTA